MFAQQRAELLHECARTIAVLEAHAIGWIGGEKPGAVHRPCRDGRPRIPQAALRELHQIVEAGALRIAARGFEHARVRVQAAQRTVRA